MFRGVVGIVECDAEGCEESLSVVYQPNELPLGHYHIRKAVLNSGWYVRLFRPEIPWQWAFYHSDNADDLRQNSGLYRLENDRYYCSKGCKER